MTTGGLYGPVVNACVENNLNIAREEDTYHNYRKQQFPLQLIEVGHLGQVI